MLGTAAELHGIAGLPPTPVIHVSVPSDRPHVQRRPEPGLTVHQLTLAEADVCRAGGVPVTTPARTVAEQYHAEGLNERPAGAGHMRCVQHDRNANSLRVKHESGVTGTPRAPATPPP
ncbi:hypothetical protein [Micromonospora aurantiaca (nom. illeg.)]|uniref:hypothetical protein n=1 Tax=Micromonospora aurantiaca (nom. illeg.) TaxID=47850 RepID=UPI0034048D9F